MFVDGEVLVCVGVLSLNNIDVNICVGWYFKIVWVEIGFGIDFFFDVEVDDGVGWDGGVILFFFI